MALLPGFWSRSASSGLILPGQQLAVAGEHQQLVRQLADEGELLALASAAPSLLSGAMAGQAPRERDRHLPARRPAACSRVWLMWRLISLQPLDGLSLSRWAPSAEM